MDGQLQTGAPDRPSFWRGVFSDSGEPSSSRILTTALGLVVAVVVIYLAWHVVHLKDAVALGQWLSNLPLVIGSLAGLMVAPYGVNRASSSVSDIIGAFRK